MTAPEAIVFLFQFFSVFVLVGFAFECLNDDDDDQGGGMLVPVAVRGR